MNAYFTITAGRTGSAWLASFLSRNLKINAVHEPLDIDDFGVRMPDIRTMRNFNNFGNNEFVQEFWKRKFASIPGGVYAETNHTLCKCGLVENLILNELEDSTTLIVLRRDLVRQCLSYLARREFENITLAWQWYLHPSYGKKIVSPEPFMKFGSVGTPVWYCYEMAARQEYYLQKFSNKIPMIEVSLEDVSTESGARDFLRFLGETGDCEVPAPKNKSKARPNEKMAEAITNILKKVNVNMPELVEEKIKDGFSFDAT